MGLFKRPLNLLKCARVWPILASNLAIQSTSLESMIEYSDSL